MYGTYVSSNATHQILLGKKDKLILKLTKAKKFIFFMLSDIFGIVFLYRS